LLFACERGHTPVVILLIQNGADINVQNSFGISGLMFANQHMFYSIVDILLCAGCDVNSCDNSGKTALMYAVRNNNRLLISALLRHHADVNIADIDGNTAFHFACSTGSVKLVNLLITADNSNLDSVNCQGNSCFMVACEFANMSVSKLLVSHNINSSMQNVVGETWSDIYGSGLCKHSFALNFIVGHISTLHDTIRLQSNWVRRKEFVMLIAQLGYILRDQKQLDLDTVLSKAVRQETSFLDKLLCNRSLVRLIMSYI
jgi:ankyrin repeat protein